MNEQRKAQRNEGKKLYMYIYELITTIIMMAQEKWQWISSNVLSEATKERNERDEVKE